MSAELLKHILKNKKKLVQNTLNSAKEFQDFRLVPIVKLKEGAKRPNQYTTNEEDFDIIKWAIVDKENYHLVKDKRWCYNKVNGYSYGKVGGKNITMHKYLFGDSEKGTWDHIRFDSKLDNRKKNLRVATNQENNRNKKMRNKLSKFRGVTRLPAAGNKFVWNSRITAEKYTVYHLFNLPYPSERNELICSYGYDFAAELLGQTMFRHLNNTKHLLTDEEIVMVQEKVERQLKKHKLI